MRCCCRVSTPSFDFPVRLQFGVVILGKEMSSGCFPGFSGVAKKLGSFCGLWLVLFRFISLPQLQVLVSVYAILPLWQLVRLRAVKFGGKRRDGRGLELGKFSRNPLGLVIFLSVISARGNYLGTLRVQSLGEA